MKNFRGIPETATVTSDLTVIENNILYVVSICDGDRVLSSMGRVFPLGTEISGEAVLEDAVRAFFRIHENEQTDERASALTEPQEPPVEMEKHAAGECKENAKSGEAEDKSLKDEDVLTTDTAEKPVEAEAEEPEHKEARTTSKKTIRKAKRPEKAEEPSLPKEEDQSQLLEAALDQTFVALECAPPNIHKLVGMKMSELEARYKTVLSYIWVQHEMGTDYVPESCMDAVRILLKK